MGISKSGNVNLLRRLVYISRSRLEAQSAAEELHAIAETSRARNTVLSVTGALLHTGTHFSQVIEGSAGDIDTLMEAIRGDSRHDDIMVIEDLSPRRRRFSEWATVYTGQAVFVQGILAGCLEQPGEPQRRSRLLRLFEEFSVR